MKLSALALCIPLLALGQTAQAAPDFAQVNDILTKNACLACHAVDKKVIGPAYDEVAAKHKGQADAAAILTKHIKEGSSGNYGPIPMPPNVGISDADIKTVVEWLVAGAPR
ncbi:c-type cytochrome [uncultured Castellaniella sp.]|jgi:cytochrome c|uniref:c-type cytochrome n=1 Tax=uncultured Castellaniella sp. TaxID=647907 RepID=UPI002620C403|nr:c-type cytochrome [uncultured Castellaniella sp.]